MIEQNRNTLIISVVLIAVFVSWMLDRSNLARKIKEERWRSKEELVEKEARLKIMEEKMLSGQKERERLPEEQGQGPSVEAGGLNREAVSTQEEAADRELAEMERLYAEQKRAVADAQAQAQQEQ